jgi:hypothetical protein
MVGDLAHARLALTPPSSHGQAIPVKVAERLRDLCVSSLELMADAAFQPGMGWQALQQAAGW